MSESQNNNENEQQNTENNIESIANPKTADDYINEGLNCYGNGDYDNAIKNFENVIELSQNDQNNIANYIKAYSLIGEIYALKANYDFSFEYCNEAIKLSKKTDDKLLQSGALLSRGFFYIQTLQYSNSVEDFNKTIELLNDYRYDADSVNEYNAIYTMASAYSNLGYAYSELLNSHKAIEHCNLAIEKIEKSKHYENYNIFIYIKALSHIHRGLAYANLLNWKQCERDSETAIEIAKPLQDQALPLYNNINSRAHNNLGLIHFSNNKFIEAIAEFNKATSFETSDIRYKSGVYTSLGLTYKALHQTDKALENYNEALRILPKYNYTYYYLGLLYEYIEDYDKATENFNQALKLNPQNNGAIIALQRVQEAKKNNIKAEKALIRMKDFYRIEEEKHGFFFVYESEENIAKSNNDLQKIINLFAPIMYIAIFSSIAISVIYSVKFLIEYFCINEELSAIYAIINDITNRSIFGYITFIDFSAITILISYFITEGAKNFFIKHNKSEDSTNQDEIVEHSYGFIVSWVLLFTLIILLLAIALIYHKEFFNIDKAQDTSTTIFDYAMKFIATTPLLFITYFTYITLRERIKISKSYAHKKNAVNMYIALKDDESDKDAKDEVIKVLARVVEKDNIEGIFNKTKDFPLDSILRLIEALPKFNNKDKSNEN